MRNTDWTNSLQKAPPEKWAPKRRQLWDWWSDALFPGERMGKGHALGDAGATGLSRTAELLSLSWE